MMMKITGALIGAAAGAVLLALGSLSAQAAPAAALQAQDGGMIMLVADGCGLDRWRDRDGRCHWDRERDRIEIAPRIMIEEPRILPKIIIEEPRHCPFGTHWSPRRRECILN
jgi:hypothetical protein